MERVGDSSMQELEPDHRGGRAGLKNRLIGEGAPFSSLRNRDFRLLLFGTLGSDVGSYAQATAIIWLVKETTGSNSWTGAVNLLQNLPVFMFVLLAGFLADRQDRKKLILTCQAVMAVTALALSLVVAFNVDSIILFACLVFLASTAYALNNPAMRALPSEIVPEDDLMNAYSLDGAQGGISRLLGSVIATGLLFAGLTSAVFFFNTASFVFIITAIIMMAAQTPAHAHEKGHVTRQVLEGIKYVRRRRWMVVLIGVLACIGFFPLALPVLMPAFAERVLGRGVGSYGILVVLFGLGSLLAAPSAAFMQKKIGGENLLRFFLMVLGGLMIWFSLSEYYWESCLLIFFMGGALAATVAAAVSMVLRGTEPQMKGRVSAICTMTLTGMLALGGQFAGVIADLRGDWPALPVIIGGAACAGFAAALFIAPRLVRDPDLPAPSLAEAAADEST
jgi:MFS family permease